MLTAIASPEPEDNKYNMFVIDGKLIFVENIEKFISTLVYTNKNSTYNNNVN